LFQVIVGDLGGGPSIQIGSGVMEVSLMPDRDEDDAQTRDAPDPESLRDPDGQVVKLDRLIEERPPEEDTDFRSEFDNRVDKQTRAPNRRPVPGHSRAPQGNRPDANDQSAATRTPTSRALPLGRDALAQRGEGSDASDAATTPSDDGDLSRNPGAGSLSPRGARGLPDALRKDWGTPGSFDDLTGIEDGAENLLNSRRWKYASFFNRVRDAVAEHWHPEVVHASRDPDGRIHGTKTRRTKLLIFLHPDGSLKRIQIERTSDVAYLDEEAIRAVRAAQPFSNPPAGLVDPQTGLIGFGFAFIFEIQGGRQIFRYQR
jgi:TonB family protein